LVDAYRKEKDPVARLQLIKGIALQRGPEADAVLADLAEAESNGTLAQLASERLKLRQAPPAGDQTMAAEEKLSVVQCPMDEDYRNMVREVKP
jgi:hypothetical protein